MTFYVYFKHKSKTTGHHQVYYTPNGFLLPRMLFHVKSSKTVTPYKLWSCTYITTSLFCVQGYMTTKVRVPMTGLPRVHPLEVQSKIQLTSCHPEHLSTCCSVFARECTVHVLRKGGTTTDYVIDMCFNLYTSEHG